MPQEKRPSVKIEQRAEGLRVSISVRSSKVYFYDLTPEELLALEIEFNKAMRDLRDNDS